MSSPSAITNKAKQVCTENAAFKKARTQFAGETDRNAVGTWWKGEAAEAFLSQTKPVQAEMDQVISKTEALESLLHRLAEKVTQADEERKRKKAAPKKTVYG